MPSPEAAKSLKLSLEARHYAGAVVLHCQSPVISGREARAIASTVSEILPFVRKMVLDLAAVETFDSAALGELVLLHMWAEASGCSLKIAGARLSLLQLFESTNVDTVLDLHASVPEALSTMVHEELQSA